MADDSIDWKSLAYRKSSYSGPNGGQCVEVASQLNLVGIRDSKNPDGGVLAVPSAAWAAFRRAL